MYSMAVKLASLLAHLWPHLENAQSRTYIYMHRPKRNVHHLHASQRFQIHISACQSKDVQKKKYFK